MIRHRCLLKQFFLPTLLKSDDSYYGSIFKKKLKLVDRVPAKAYHWNCKNMRISLNNI